jgi:hypothetical protein
MPKTSAATMNPWLRIRRTQVRRAADQRQPCPSKSGSTITSPSRRSAGKVVVLRALLACGGLAAEWFALGGGGLPPPRIEFVLRAGRDEPLVAADETPVRLATPPAAPPPRAA